MSFSFLTVIKFHTKDCRAETENNIYNDQIFRIRELSKVSTLKEDNITELWFQDNIVLFLTISGITLALVFLSSLIGTMYYIHLEKKKQIRQRLYSPVDDKSWPFGEDA